MKKIRNPNKNNQKRSEEAQRRIQAALALLQERQQLPTAITARATAIRAVSSVSFRTLYKHLSLWHPDHQSGSRRGLCNELQGFIP